MRRVEPCLQSCWARLILIVVLASGVAGCGGSGGTTTSGPDVFGGGAQSTTSSQASGPGGTTTSSDAASTSAAAIAGLKQVGTTTESGPGTRFSEDYQVGPIGYAADASAASAALNACGGNTATDPASDAYAEGQVTFNYSQGTQPLSLSLDFSKAIQSAGIFVSGDQSDPNLGVSGVLSIDVGGSWTCGQDATSPVAISLQPGQTTTYDFWLILPGATSNAQPQLSQLQLNSLVFYPKTSADNQTLSGSSEAGPSVVDCGYGKVMMPFAPAPPFPSQTVDSNYQLQPTTCHAAA